MPMAAERRRLTGRRSPDSTASCGCSRPSRLSSPKAGLASCAMAFTCRGRGYGRFLLADALFRAVRSEIASFAIIVDAKDDAARRFYERESFLPLPDQPLRLFRSMADIAKLYE
jgi:GNAT superfamily N-acetyltransferase